MGLEIKSVKSQKKELGVSYGAHLTSSPIVGTVTKDIKKSNEFTPAGGSQSETIHPGVFGSGLSIMVEGGRTLNLGNFESARIGVSITVPCTPETLNDAYEWATDWVSEKIEKATKDAKGE